MASFNSVTLVGNLTRDPELRFTPSGMAVMDIGLAVNDRIKKGEQWVDETTFIDCTLWGKTAENAAKFLHKGSPVLAHGRLKMEKWEDEKTGKTNTKHKVVVDQLKFLEGKKKDEDDTGDLFSQPVGAGTKSSSSEDAPF